MIKWNVNLVGQAKKYDKHLSSIAQKAFLKLLRDLLDKGPNRYEWANYSKLDHSTYHCHLKKGRPTYVCCWQLISKEYKQIEVYYAGTHEDAPY